MKKFIGEFGTITPEILVVGRRDDHTGLAEHSKMIGRMFGTYLPLRWIDIHESGSAKLIQKHLESGKQVIFAEMPWHNTDITQVIVGRNSGKLSGIFVWDSDEIPSDFVRVLRCFDNLITPSLFIENAIKKYLPASNVLTLPLALDNRKFWTHYLEREKRAQIESIPRIGTVAALHRRKNLDLLLSVALKLWRKGLKFELAILANSLQGTEILNEVKKIQKLEFGHLLILISNDLGEQQYCEFIGKIDIFVSVSSGEGFNIPARQALASGALAVLSEVPGHEDLLSFPEVITIPSLGKIPAVYPEFGNQIFGKQDVFSVGDIEAAVESALGLLKTRKEFNNSQYRNIWDFRSLESRYRSGLFKPTTNKVRVQNPILAVVGHDAGFFSLFNTYLSIKNYWEGDNGFSMVIPDWRVRSIKEFWNTDKFTSFCYGNENDGNIYFKLFDTNDQFQVSQAEVDDLLDNSLKAHSFNASADPNLTYIHADKLYRSSNFENWRQSMFETMAGLSPNQNIMNRLNQTFAQVNTDDFIIGMHVRHASHAMEQPDRKMASSEDFIRLSYELIDEEDLRNPGRKIRIFLASDQEKVITEFTKEFGNSLLTISNVSRVDAGETEKYDKLDSDARLKEGHQIQHLKASNESSWNLNMAEDVIADAWGLSKCHTLVHTVSNVATAVSFINPKLRCVPIYPDFSLSDIQELVKLRQMSPLI